MAKAAVIFDVDGVLLKLTPEEEVLFFAPFAKRCDAAKLSRDWNSYRIRNDVDIIAELVESHSLPVSECELIRQEYLSLLRQKLLNKTVTSQKITGVQELLDQLSGATLGIATANFREAAKLRLEQAELWHHIAAHAFGADGGGHKHEILNRSYLVRMLDVNAEPERFENPPLGLDHLILQVDVVLVKNHRRDPPTEHEDPRIPQLPSLNKANILDVN